MSLHPVTLNRRATDQGEPSNREIMSSVGEMRSTLESFIIEQRAKNASVDTWRAQVDLAAGLRQNKLDNLAAATTPELQGLHDFKVKVETLTSFAKYATGGSLIAAVASIVAVIVSIAALTSGAK